LERTRSFIAACRPFAEQALKTVWQRLDRELAEIKERFTNNGEMTGFIEQSQNYKKNLYDYVREALGFFKTTTDWESKIIADEEYGLASFPEEYRKAFDRFSTALKNIAEERLTNQRGGQLPNSSLGINFRGK
jgi:hypothetical protein